MTTRLHEVQELAARVCQGRWDDTRPMFLRDLAAQEPPCKAYTLFFYAWIAAMKPKLVVETGTDTGRTTLHMATAWSKTKVVTIDMAAHCKANVDAHGLPNLVAVTGDSAAEAVRFAPESIDVLFLDSEHTYEHVTREFKSFLPRMRPGGLVFMDDIELTEGMQRVWAEIEYPKRELKLHFTGFGVFQVPG